MLYKDACVTSWRLILVSSVPWSRPYLHLAALKKSAWKANGTKLLRSRNARGGNIWALFRVAEDPSLIEVVRNSSDTPTRSPRTHTSLWMVALAAAASTAEPSPNKELVNTPQQIYAPVRGLSIRHRLIINNRHDLVEKELCLERPLHLSEWNVSCNLPPENWPVRASEEHLTPLWCSQTLNVHHVF